MDECAYCGDKTEQLYECCYWCIYCEECWCIEEEHKFHQYAEDDYWV